MGRLNNVRIHVPRKSTSYPEQACRTSPLVYELISQTCGSPQLHVRRTQYYSGEIIVYLRNTINMCFFLSREW